jgi:hypothetical protein
MGVLVLVRGVLTGRGRHLECELIARKVLAARFADPVYSECSIIRSPDGLPDGEYIAYSRVTASLLRGKMGCGG